MEKQSFNESAIESPDVIEQDYEIMSDFKERRTADDIHQEWEARYYNDPRSFFSEENLTELEKVEPGKRLIWLARASNYLTSTPEMARRYFAVFPADLRIISELFEEQHGYVNSVSELALFSISAPEIERILSQQNRPINNRMGSFLEQYLNIAERKNKAPDHLLNNFEHRYNKSFAEFGTGADGFLKALNEADELSLSGDHFIDPDQIFTAEYQAMPEQAKAGFLRKALAELHFSLLFYEVYNSCFTEKMMERISATMRQGKKGGQPVHWNVVHSMLYKTAQPISVYNMSQDIFSQDMDSSAMRGGDIEEYPMHRLLQAVLKELKEAKGEKAENTKVLVDFWDKNRNPIFGNGVADALSEQDTGLAVSELLKLIREEKNDKTPLAAILYRLEFGKVGISEEGVKYLERMYDLGEYNNPDYHVSRLTADGEVGVFNEDQELIKYFHLGDLSSPEKQVQAKVLDFVYETLFIGQKDETEAETNKRLQYLEEFKKNYYNIANDDLFAKTGVKLNNLSFKEQGWFVIYFNEADDQEKDRLKQFVAEHGEEGIKTFLALEASEENGHKILSIGENLERHVAAGVFSKFNEVASLIKQSNQELSQRFFNNDRTIEPAAEILKRAEKVLTDYEQKITELNYAALPEEEKKKINQEMALGLSQTKRETVFFAAMFKTAYKERPNVNLDEVRGLDLGIQSSSQLIDQDRKQLISITKENYRHNSKQQTIVLNGLETALNNQEKTRWYILKKQGQDNEEGPRVLAFVRFDEQEDGSLYAASLNVSPDFRGSALGEALYHKAVDRESRNGTLKGIVEINKPVSSYYLEKGGFVAVGAHANPATKIPYFDIVRDNRANNLLTSRQEGVSSQTLIEKSYHPNKKISDLLGQEPIFILRLESDGDDIIKTVNQCVAQGYLLTRLFPDPDDSQHFYYTFELNPQAKDYLAAA